MSRVQIFQLTEDGWRIRKQEVGYERHHGGPPQETRERRPEASSLSDRIEPLSPLIRFETMDDVALAGARPDGSQILES